MGLLYGNLYTSHIHMLSTMFDFFRKCIVIACGNYFKTIVNVLLKQQIMLQLMYNVHICDHVMCPHFHHPLWDTFVINF
jgi:hypothetical protein